MPAEMIQAAMTAINNRAKVNSIDRLKSKGKAPRPPSRNEMDDSSDSVDHISVKIESEMSQMSGMKFNNEGSQPDLGEYFKFEILLIGSKKLTGFFFNSFLLLKTQMLNSMVKMFNKLS